MSDGTIFINYRRDDSRGDAGRLYDRLQALYPGRVFRDVGFLEPGVEWHEAIAKALGDADACVVVIGRRWLAVTDSAGRRRIDNPRDTVRQEIATALNNGMPIFPVLVGDAEMPAEEDLPLDIQGLAKRNALELSEQSWDDDFKKLVLAIERALGWGPTHRAEPAAVSSGLRRRATTSRVLAASALVLVAIGIGFAAFRTGQFVSKDTPPARAEMRRAMSRDLDIPVSSSPREPAAPTPAESRTPAEQPRPQAALPSATQPPASTAGEPVPRTPTVFHQCRGVPEVCAALRAAFDRALDQQSLAIARDSGGAEIAITANTSILEERVEQQFGTTFAVRTYSVEVAADARRWRQAVPMPTPATFTADLRFGRERISENATVIASSAVEHLQAFWSKRVP